MIKCRVYSFLILLLGVFNSVFAQPPAYIYEGGVGGGFASATEMSTNIYMYKGGNSDGFSSLVNNATNIYFYKGGNADGFATTSNAANNVYLYKGGVDGGYAQDMASYQSVTFYEGGAGQGYSLEVKCQEFIWTGTEGTGWGVADNWNYSVVPDIGRPVIIPAGAPNYPSVNAGTLAIGENPNSGAFTCKSLWIQNGGEVITRINNFVENYGQILIDGNMRVKNSAANALQNINNGEIKISSTGSLIIKP